MTLTVSSGHVVSDLGHTGDHNAIVLEILRHAAILDTTGTPSGIATLGSDGILTVGQRPPAPAPPPSPFDATHLPVLTFTSATARNAALPSPIDGQIVWLIAEKRQETRVNASWEAQGAFVDNSVPIIAGSYTPNKPVFYWGGYVEDSTASDGKFNVGVPASTPSGPTTAVIGCMVQPVSHVAGQEQIWFAILQYGSSSLSQIRFQVRDDTGATAPSKAIAYCHWGWYQ